MFLDAGPLMLSRGGALVALTFLPVSLVIVYVYCLHRKFAGAILVVVVTVETYSHMGITYITSPHFRA